jgi:hypothetical protein
MKKTMLLTATLCTATALYCADIPDTHEDASPAVEPTELTATSATPLTNEYILICILEQVIPCTHTRALYVKKYAHLLNAALSQLHDTNAKAYDALITPIIENQAGTLETEQAQEQIKNALSKKSLAYQLCSDIQLRYEQELEASCQQTTKINAALDKKYERLHLQLQIATAATIIVGYLQISRLFGYKLFPFMQAHVKVERI